MITGGDSYCYLQLSRDFHQMTLVRKGENPLYDVNATFVDQAQVISRLAKGTPTLEEFESIRRHMALGNLGSETALGLKSILLAPISGDASFVIYFNGRNGFWNQNLQVHKIENGWAFATRVSRQIIGTAGTPVLSPIFEQVDEGFPKPVDWRK